MRKLVALAALVLALGAIPVAQAVNLDEPGGGSWQAPGADTAQLGTTAWECYELLGYDAC